MASKPPSPELLEMLRVRVGLAADDPSRDDEITAAYLGALSWIEQYLDRFMEAGTFTEKFTHVASNKLSLKGYPVESVASMTADDMSGPPISYHVEASNGLIRFDGFAVAHEITVVYDADPQISGAILAALLALFDVVWSTFNSSSSEAEAGVVKSITSDGARVEFDVSGGSSSFGAVDPSSGMPSAVAAMLHLYRRESV
jgi:hypothetical protein